MGTGRENPSVSLMEFGILDTPTKHLSAYSVAALATIDNEDCDVVYSGYASNPDDAITLMREAFAEDHSGSSDRISLLLNIKRIATTDD